MATQPASPDQPAARRTQRSTRVSFSTRAATSAAQRTRSSRLPGCALRPWADLAGQAVALSRDVPTSFDGPLAPHHKAIGRWVASRADANAQYSRAEARRYIEREFNAAVLDILKPVEIANLRAVVLTGDEDLPPALIMICDDVGQLDLKWIEKSNVLAETMLGHVAPVGWRATAYKALVDTLRCVLPVFAFDDLFEELSGYYWDGCIDDAGARESLMQWHGHSEDDVDEMVLPSQVRARRPDFMLAENTAPLKQLPVALADRLRAVRKAAAAVRAIGPEGNAWHFDFHDIAAYLPHFEDVSHMPPLTLVPFDHFARELDDAARHGMEQGFMDVTGICPLAAADKLEAWFTSLRLGVEFLLAAQALIDLDPAKV